MNTYQSDVREFQRIVRLIKAGLTIDETCKLLEGSKLSEFARCLKLMHVKGSTRKYMAKIIVQQIHMRAPEFPFVPLDAIKLTQSTDTVYNANDYLKVTL